MSGTTVSTLKRTSSTCWCIAFAAKWTRKKPGSTPFAGWAMTLALFKRLSIRLSLGYTWLFAGSTATVLVLLCYGGSLQRGRKEVEIIQARAREYFALCQT